jgi:protein-L-isoaspartate(D-aspartate) O-methyltransferase
MTGNRFIRSVLLALFIATALMAGQGRAQGNRAGNPAARRPTLEELRGQMVDRDIAAAGVKNPRVLAAMRATPRHEFMPANLRHMAYYDMGLPIGDGQTISPPYLVATMTEAIDPQPQDRVLEIGTGSGYQAAVLSGLVKDVYTIEILESLGKRATQTLKRLKYENVHTKIGDGYLGWPEHAPFDKIIVTCSPEKVPQPLVDQLKEGGRIVIPVGERYQQTLYLMKKTDGKMGRKALLPTFFVPMTGEEEKWRKIKPDPKNPSVRNGDFQDVNGDPPQMVAWHYQRQMEVVTSANAAAGKRYGVRFHNTDPGRFAQALQAFAVDGRYVRKLQISLHVRYRNFTPDPAIPVAPLLEVVFYDDNRNIISDQSFGAPHGTSDWKTESKKLDVPVRAREAIMRIGMFGATGELLLDNVQMQGLPY